MLAIALCSSSQFYMDYVKMSDGLDLKVFIREALMDIVEGIKEAQSIDEQTGKYIASRLTYNMKSPDDALIIKGNRDIGTIVEFDVAVTADARSSSDGRGSIKVFPLEFGGKHERQAQNITATRMKFAVPILIPTIEWPKDPD